MSESEYQDEAEQLVNDLPDDLDVSVEEVAEQLHELIEDFSIPQSEASITLRNKYVEQYDGDEDFGSTDTDSAAEHRTIGSLSPDEVSEDETLWITVKGTVQTLFELSEAQASWIHQRGVIADNTGECIFTIPEDAISDDQDVELEEGESYELETVASDVYEDSFDVKVTSASEVAEIDEEFTPPTGGDSARGRIVLVQDGSGLIKRCTVEEDGEQCNRALRSGRCNKHGNVEGDFDLRIMATLDDGTETQNVYFNREQTEAIVDITLDEAIEEARENIQGTPVRDMVEQLLIGREYEVSGIGGGEYLTTQEFTWHNEPIEPEKAQRLQNELNSLEVKA